MHRPLFVLAAGSVAAVGGLLVASAMPAGAATAGRAETMARTVGCVPLTGGACADTPVTFSVSTTGVLAITAPTGTVDLGSGASHGVGTTIGAPGNFGAVAVIDNRALNPADWTATVSSTPFTNTTSADVIPVGDATYTIPATGTGSIGVDSTSGLPLSTGIVDNASPGIALTGTAQDVATETGADGDNAATWDPEIDVAVPAGSVIGIYDGTVTHSVT